MNRFYDAGGGCFSGNGVVELQSGKTKRVADLCKGDVLVGGATVECLVETLVESEQQVVELNGVLFTPYHPIAHNGCWCFPIILKQPELRYVDRWYNLVVSGRGGVSICGIEAITLGHGRTDGVLAHPYFGTDKVIEALQSHTSFSSGHVVVSNPIVVHDDSGLIVGYY
eukprot:gnl/Chilomastix_caulleri/655.p1 GENE.gnl/Chilomastix_caulleri/655~~gnl/Chilomastix_caulleri/655.p1  ORF type:complete len:169 (+),score=41.13 gnl/Chilomastix_caulleri/655:523-1029(+)